MLRLVTDSTSDLLPDAATALGVTVVPLTVRFGEEQFADGVEIDAATFYARLQGATALPTTSQPSPEQFAAVYREQLQGADDHVLSVHLSPNWSGTLQSAALAAQECDGRVTTVDGGTVSVGLQLLLSSAARDRTDGLDVDSIVQNTRARVSRVRIYALLDTLTYLHRGGRIGRAQAFVGGLLNVKPLLRIEGGEIHPLARTRRRQQGIERLFELVAAEGPLEAVGAMHSAVPAEFARVRERLARTYPELEVLGGEIGPVVGTYAGPAAIGAAVLRAG